jgi:hypothetical protein
VKLVSACLSPTRPLIETDLTEPEPILGPLSQIVFRKKYA